MIKRILLINFLLFSNSIYTYAENIATPIKQTDPSKNKVAIYGSTTIGYKELKLDNNGNLLVYDSASGAVGTTTSNMYITDGSQWVGLRGNTSTGIAYFQNKTGNVNDITTGHPYIGCLSYATKTSSFLSNQLLISAQTGKTLYILGIQVTNYSTTSGMVDFYWNSAGTDLCYPSAIGSSVGSGYITDVYRTRSDGGLYITTQPTSLAIIVYYLQQ